MPILVPVNELQPGMRLAEAFVQRNRVMLPGGKKLNPADVDILQRKYAGIHVKIGHPLLDSMADFEDDAYERDIARQAQSRIAHAITDVEKRLSSHTEMAPKDFDVMQQSARGVMRFLAENPVSAALICKTIDSGSYLADHTASVMFLTMSLGNAVKTYIATERQRQTNAKELHPSVAFDLTPLGLGAMFMDVGMYKLAEAFKQGRNELSTEERKLIREHPNAGAEMLPESFPPASRMIVRTHHENYDGTGYPNMLPREKQHVFTRIVRICDSYDAATSTALHHDAKTPARAIWEMTVGPYRKYYDPVLMKVFAGLIQPFPIGAKLTLASGCECVVVRYNRRNPFRPTVIIVSDEDGKELPKHKIRRQIKLEHHPDLTLGWFGDEDLSYVSEIDVFPEPQDDAEDVGDRFGSLFAAAFP